MLRATGRQTHNPQYNHTECFLIAAVRAGNYANVQKALKEKTLNRPILERARDIAKNYTKESYANIVTLLNKQLEQSKE